MLNERMIFARRLENEVKVYCDKTKRREEFLWIKVSQNK